MIVEQICSIRKEGSGYPGFKVNDKVITDFVDEKNTFIKGHLALQQRDPKSVVYHKHLMYKSLK